MKRREFVGGMGAAAAAPVIGSAVAAAPAPAREGAAVEPFDEIDLEDRMRILDQVGRYAWAFDAGDLQGYLDRFWPDGALEHPRRDGSPGRWEGHAGITEFVTASFSNRRTQTWGHQHQIHTPVMERKGPDRVMFNAYCTVMRHEFHRTYWPSGPSFRLGTWHALFRKEQGVWRIENLDVRMWTDMSLGETGADLVDRPPHSPGTR